MAAVGLNRLSCGFLRLFLPARVDDCWLLFPTAVTSASVRSPAQVLFSRTLSSPLGDHFLRTRARGSQPPLDGLERDIVDRGGALHLDPQDSVRRECLG